VRLLALQEYPTHTRTAHIQNQAEKEPQEALERLLELLLALEGLEVLEAPEELLCALWLKPLWAQEKLYL
jgi:hypothetical protein